MHCIVHFFYSQQRKKRRKEKRGYPYWESNPESQAQKACALVHSAIRAVCSFLFIFFFCFFVFLTHSSWILTYKDGCLSGFSNKVFTIFCWVLRHFFKKCVVQSPIGHTGSYSGFWQSKQQPLLSTSFIAIHVSHSLH